MEVSVYPGFKVYWGTAADTIYPHDYLAFVGSASLAQQEPYARVCRALGVEEVTFCRQVHGIQGVEVHQHPYLSPHPFAVEADFLITAAPVALGVMSADCLPIIIHDPDHGALGIVHAGWRSSYGGIHQSIMTKLDASYTTQSDKVQVLFGACAQVCCYEVTEEFVAQFLAIGASLDVFCYKQGKIFFDQLAFSRQALIKLGVLPSSFVYDHALCTICDHRFFSYRRERERAGRNMTVVALQ